MGVWATRQRTVVRACAICGDEVALAKRLGFPVGKVVNWLLGDEPISTDEFLMLVDIVLDDNRKLVEQNQSRLAEIRQKYRG